MKHLAVITAFLVTAVGCVDRYPDTDYMSTYLTNPGTQDTSGGGGQDAVVQTDTGGQNDTAISGFDTLQDTPFVTCLKYYCPIPLAACGLNQGCIAVLTCLNKCSASDTTCQGLCYPTSGANTAFENLFICAASSCNP